MEFITQLPPVTKIFLGGCFFTTLLTTLKVVSVLRLFLYFPSVWHDFEVWRLLTNFLFFDSSFSLHWFFNVFFFTRHCSSLEEESFHGRKSDFVYMWVFGVVSLLVLDGILFSFSSTAHLTLPFLGPSLTFMITYIWSRRNRHVMMTFFGLFNFTAPFLPLVLIGFSFLMGGNPIHDIFGMIVGHIYYYLEDVYPLLNGGFHLLKTPKFLTKLIDQPQPPIAPMEEQAHVD